MATLNATVGLPGCGKTTRARAWVAEDPTHRARANRDDIRVELHGGWVGTPEAENEVTAEQHARVGLALAAGLDVVCDDTNLNPEHLRALEDLAGNTGAGFVVWDMTDVPLQVCIDRDARRPDGQRVGADTIRAMHERYRRDRAAGAG